jgi:hypothetical protein
MAFFVYRNTTHKSVVIHRGICGHCRDGHGKLPNLLGTFNGQWFISSNNGYLDYQSAVESADYLAQEMNTNFRNCRVCRPEA